MSGYFIVGELNNTGINNISLKFKVLISEKESQLHFKFIS